MRMKNRKIYIGIVIVIILCLVIYGVASYFSNASVAARQSRIISSGISDIQGASATTTASSGSTTVAVGTGTTLGVRTVSEKAAYSRLQAEWIWVKTVYANPSFAPSGPTKEKDFVLTLNENESLSVVGDCNGIKGTFSIDENTVSALETIDEMALGKMKIKASAVTKKSCQYSKEGSFIVDMQKVNSYDMRTNQLTLLLANNEGYMVFKRNLELEG